MKNYIIYLPQFQTSVDLANKALKTGLKYDWEIYLYEGIDGRSVSDDNDWNLWKININQRDNKCQKMMNKSGVRGCFLSHYSLWKHCIDNNEIIGIFEHDVEFINRPPNKEIEDLLKLEGYELQKPRPAGLWYEGARAYIITPNGAKKLIDWIKNNGCLPTDVNIGKDIINIELDHESRIKIQDSQIHNSRLERHTNSFTWNLEQMV